MTLQASVQTIVDQAANEVAKLRAQEARDITSAIRDKSSMVANYWVPRWRAEQKLRAAREIMEAISNG
jgi:hypothetical protein